MITALRTKTSITELFAMPDVDYMYLTAAAAARAEAFQKKLADLLDGVEYAESRTPLLLHMLLLERLF